MKVTFSHLLAAAALLASALTSGGYPTLANTARPNPEPALPSWFDSYTPPVGSETPSPSAPAIAEWTHTGRANDTLVLTGSNFSSFGGANQGIDTNFVVFGQTSSTNRTTISTAICRLDGLKAAVTLGSALPPDSMYLLWPGNNYGYGAPVAINKTDAWWLGPETTTRGAAVSVYGQILRSDAVHQSAVYLKPLGNLAGVWARVTAVNACKVDFVVPGSLANGAYEVWVHNGHGGSYGWSGPLALKVDSGPGWTGQELNAKAFGATGNGTTDDEPALASAIDAAAAHPGSTLFLPAGTYKISNYLTIPSSVRLRGAGPDSTTIKLNVTDSAHLPPVVVYAAGSNIELLDMTLTATGALPTDPDQYIPIVESGDGSQDLRFTNLRLDGRGSETFFLIDTRRTFFTNCEIIGHNGYLQNAIQVFGLFAELSGWVKVRGEQGSCVLDDWRSGWKALRHGCQRTFYRCVD